MATAATGAGFSTFGISFAGYGIPSSETSLNKYTLIDDFGNTSNARLIDPETRDYRFTNGYIVGGNDVQQLVYLALLTVRNSSSLNSFGQSFSSIKVIGIHYKTRVVSAVNEALRNLINNKIIELIEVNTVVSGNRVKIDVRWKDIKTGTKQQTII